MENGNFHETISESVIGCEAHILLALPLYNADPTHAG